MVGHIVYSAIVQAVKKGELKESFTQEDFSRVCPGFGDTTYQAFLYIHRKGNPVGASELFEINEPGKFRLLRPFRSIN